MRKEEKKRRKIMEKVIERIMRGKRRAELKIIPLEIPKIMKRKMIY